MNRKLTLQKSPESGRDWLLRSVLQTPKELPSFVSLIDLCGPVRDQGGKRALPQLCRGRDQKHTGNQGKGLSTGYVPPGAGQTGEGD